MDYNHSTLSLFDLFNRNAVDYMVVGGTAVAIHGYVRRSVTAKGETVDKPDLDFWYNPSYPNYFRLLDALAELGRDVTEYRDDPAPDPRKSVFRLEFEDYTLDLLPAIKASLTFRECFARRYVVERDGVAVPFISLDDLIHDKQALGRQKDLADIAHLRRNNAPGL